MTSVIAASDEVVTFRIGAQWFGVPVLRVQEVIGPQRLSRIPLAAAGIAGLLNLRGQIVTAMDLHQRLEILRFPSESLMNVVVRDGDELFALIVDEVGDVAAVPPGSLEALPPSLDAAWLRVCTGVARVEQGLLAVLDVTRLLDEPNTRP